MRGPGRGAWGWGTAGAPLASQGVGGVGPEKLIGKAVGLSTLRGMHLVGRGVVDWCIRGDAPESDHLLRQQLEYSAAFGRRYRRVQQPAIMSNILPTQKDIQIHAALPEFRAQPSVYRSGQSE